MSAPHVKTEGAPQGALPLRPAGKFTLQVAESNRRRVFCQRLPQGHERDEIRIEGFLTDALDDTGFVALSHTAGNSLTVEWHEIRDVVEALELAKDALWEAYQTAKANAHG